MKLRSAEARCFVAAEDETTFNLTGVCRVNHGKNSGLRNSPAPQPSRTPPRVLHERRNDGSQIHQHVHLQGTNRIAVLIPSLHLRRIVDGGKKSKLYDVRSRCKVSDMAQSRRICDDMLPRKNDPSSGFFLCASPDSRTRNHIEGHLTWSIIRRLPRNQTRFHL